MTLRSIFAVSLSLITGLCLTACRENSANIAEHQAQEYQQILKNFSLEDLPPVAEKTQALKAPHDPMRITLAHTDALDLPDGNFVISGSDTVSPVTRRLAAAFHDDGYIGTFRLNQSSTGTGMKAMCRGEGVDLVNASRKMKDKERLICDANGITPIIIRLGYDPFVLITNENNDWLKDISRTRLRALFNSQNWNQFNSKSPNKPIRFLAPVRDGGSMAAMTEFVYGDKEHSGLREGLPNAQYYPYNLELTRDLAESPYGLGFASYGKLMKIKQLKVNIIPIDGAIPVVSGGRYPIKRSLYIVTNTMAIQKPEVQSFIAYYLNHSHQAMPPLGFSPLEGLEAQAERRKLIAILGDIMGDENTVSIAQK